MYATIAAPRSASISAVSEDLIRDSRQSKANEVAAAATISPTKSDHLNETTSDKATSGVPASRAFSNERDEIKREEEVEQEEEVEEEKERLIGTPEMKTTAARHYKRMPVKKRLQK